MSLWRDEHGSSAIEYGLIGTVLLALTFGIIDIGYLLFQWQAVSKATQVGVRKAVVSDPVATGLLDFDGTDGSSVIGTPCLDAGTGGPIADCDFGTVTCTGLTCTAMGGVNQPAFDEILAEMQKVMPRLTQANVSIRYVPNGFGFVGYRIPATVTVSVIGMNYEFFALSAFQTVFPASMPLPPSPATLTGEDFDS